MTGVITPEVAFEVNLPDRWNRRFYMTGNGGLAGDALDGPTNPDRTAGLSNGFVHARTNTGHDARKEPSGSFILSNPQKAIDYAYRAVHVTAETAKKIATDYYAQPILFSYWNSCSNGGRQGLLEAQRYPDDFDGIVANAPWVDQTGFTIGAMWNQKALTEAPVSPAKLLLVAQKVMDKCDAVDGLKDGLIDDPRACRFDASRDVPACSAGADTADCLTAAQAATINKIYSGPSSKGKPFMAGFMPGSEAVTTAPNGTTNSGWVGAIVPAQPGAKPADFNLAEGVMRYLILDPPQPEYDFMTFDYDRDTALVERWSKLADAKDADLSRFRKSGGKVIMTYGWADQILQPMMGVNYYEAVVAKNGSGTLRLRAPVHDAGRCALRRRHRTRSRRCRDGGDRLGGEEQGARLVAGEQGDQRHGDAHAPALPVSAGGALQGAGQHRRRGELQLRGTTIVISTPGFTCRGSR